MWSLFLTSSGVDQMGGSRAKSPRRTRCLLSAKSSSVAELLGRVLFARVLPLLEALDRVAEQKQLPLPPPMLPWLAL